MRYKSSFYENCELDIKPSEVIAFILNENSGKIQGELTEPAKLFKYFVFPVVHGLRLEYYGFSAWFKTYDEAIEFIEKEKGWTDAK